MSKSTALLLLIALLLFASLAEAARHEPADPANAQQQVSFIIYLFSLASSFFFNIVTEKKKVML